MVCYKWCICTFVALLSAISSTTAKKHHANQIVSDTIVVDPSGKGNFRTIQAAINSIPSSNKRWTCISIKKGLYRCVLAVYIFSCSCIYIFRVPPVIYVHCYREKVTIPRDRPYIYLKGEGTRNTVLQWNAHGSIDTTATFSSLADYTIARGIKFVVRS